MHTLAFHKEHPLYQADLAHILKQVPALDKLRGKRLLITGATGLVGSVLIDALLQFNKVGEPVQLIAVGRDKAKAAARFGTHFDLPYFSFFEHDVTQAFPDDLHADYILPMASHTHPLAYSHYPIDTMMANLKGAEHALELAARCNATVLYVSSNEIYGTPFQEEVFEEDCNGKLNLSTARACYTESKRAAEALCLSYAAQRGVSVKIARLTRCFGPSVLDADSKASSQFIRKAIFGEDIILKSEGKQVFSFVYVADAVTALLHILLHGEQATAYNIANDLCVVSLREFAETCATFAHTKVVFDLPSEMERRGYSIAQRAVLSTSRLKAIGWEGKFSFQDALSRTLQILKGN